MSDKNKSAPLTYRLAAWWGFLFSALFLIYGVVEIILGVLDRNYSDMGKPIILGLIGVALITVAFAYRELKVWGWYGLAVINALIVVLAVVGYRDTLNLLLIPFAGIAFGCLLWPQTKQYIFRRR
ncbi:MAG: hypothetical protein ABII79_04775 [bacterium]